MNLFSLVATLGLDTSGFSKDVGKAVDEGKKLGNNLTKMVNVGAKVVGAMAIAAGTAYVSIVKKAVDAEADLEQNIGGSQTTWEGMSRAMHQYATRAYEDVGLGTSQYLEMSTKMGNLLQGMGIDNRQAAAMTVDAIQRTADVAAAMNIPIEDAMQAVLGMSKGNFSMMDNLGVAMNETALNAYALEKGIKRGTKGMSQAEKIALAMEMYMDKTAKHAGTFAKEAEGLSGALTVLKASWKNFLDGSGSPEEFAESMNTYIDAYIEKVGEVAPRMLEALKIVGKHLGEKIQNWAQSKGGWGEVARISVDWALGALKMPSTSEITETVTNWWTGMEGGNAYETIKNILKWSVGDVIMPTVADLTDKFSAWWESDGAPGVKAAAKWTFGELILPAWTDLTETVGEWWDDMATNFNENLSYKWGGFELPSWSDIESKVSQWWEDIKKQLKGLMSIKINIGGFSWGGGDEPETPVVTGADGSQTRSHVGGSGDSFTINNYVTTTPNSVQNLANELTYATRYGGGRPSAILAYGR